MTDDRRLARTRQIDGSGRAPTKETPSHNARLLRTEARPRGAVRGAHNNGTVGQPSCRRRPDADDHWERRRGAHIRCSVWSRPRQTNRDPTTQRADRYRALAAVAGRGWHRHRLIDWEIAGPAPLI